MHATDWGCIVGILAGIVAQNIFELLTSMRAWVEGKIFFPTLEGMFRQSELLVGGTEP